MENPTFESSEIPDMKSFVDKALGVHAIHFIRQKVVPEE